MSPSNVYSFARLNYTSTLALVLTLVACNGAPKVDFETPTAQTTVNENNNAAFWTAHARVQGGSTADIKYSLAGIDAALFTLNESSGVLAFKHAADFENPQDTNKDNEYIVDIKASLKDSSAIQALRINVNNETRPVLKLVKPQLNENVGDNVTSLVEFYDEESNSPANGGSVTFNGKAFLQSAANSLLWSADVSIPVGGLKAELIGITADKKIVKMNAQFLNKQNALKPFLMGPSRNNTIFVYDPVKHLIADLNLANNIWSIYFSDARLNPTEFVLDFDLKEQSIYFFIDLATYAAGNFLMALNFETLPVTQFGGFIEGAVSITWDNANRRVIVLTKTVENGISQYRALAVSKQNGFFRSLPLNPQTTLLWTLSPEVIEGTFKYFAYHGASKTFLVASERDKNTVIKAYAESGQKQFEVALGPDISNLMVDQTKGLVYVAENHSTSQAKLKTIAINNGDIADLGEYRGSAAVGAYSDIRLDSAATTLYVGDTVSDSIFAIDLVTKSMQEIPLVFDSTRAPFISLLPN